MCGDPLKSSKEEQQISLKETEEEKTDSDGDTTEQGRWGERGAEAKRGDTGSDMPVQIGAAGRVGGGQIVAGAAICEGPVPRLPGEHDRGGLPHTDRQHRRYRGQVRDLGHGRTGAI